MSSELKQTSKMQRYMLVIIAVNYSILDVAEALNVNP